MAAGPREHSPQFCKSQTAFGIYGGLFGASVYGLALYISPAIIQSATYAIGGALASVLGASVGVYMAAMVAVAAATVILGVFLGLALRMAFQHWDAKQNSSSWEDNSPKAPI